MFAGFWSVIPVWVANVFRRKSYIILGGTDCVSFPEYNYGALRKSMQSKTIRYTLNNCSTILPVAEALRKYDYTYFDAVNKKQGFEHYFPEVNTPTKVIHNGYTVSEIGGKTNRKTNSFISVARIDNPVTFALKGINLVVEMAKNKPESSLTIVGISKEMVKLFELDQVSNLTCIRFLDSDELVELYKKHQFCLCLSISEGFPNALCEGMSFGCVPIGSNVSSIPFIIGKTGFILETKDIQKMNDLIEKVINTDSNRLKEMSIAARNRIQQDFNLQKRKDAFYHLVG
jgi:glycosyltransferase involved in cell wall biosynthesis